MCVQQLEIGGGKKYEGLREGFILAAVTPSKDREEVVVKGYLVKNTGA